MWIENKFLPFLNKELCPSTVIQSSAVFITAVDLSPWIHAIHSCLCSHCSYDHIQFGLAFDQDRVLLSTNARKVTKLLSGLKMPVKCFRLAARERTFQIFDFTESSHQIGHTHQMTVHLKFKMATTRENKCRSTTGKIIFYSSSYFYLRALKPKLNYKRFDYLQA